MAPDKMIRMGNQIAAFFRTQPGIDPAVKTLEHITDFWEPRMRQQLRDYVADGGAGLDPEVIAATKMMA
ncbi:formate dehydrogenase subunit delta [Pacificibacter maritimus]|uniref:Formate dehydrogenase subunit delta n=1 Tax=Pacificibacter maritimus TaxID=762213 RepID=A0A3N4URP7_9RHOB|nr:formate dehydrogenase subunit delta [Pacificibacter maritimus]RPE71345.1 formate dehydrogenase subunit delta [Pacificibacter maritimus]